METQRTGHNSAICIIPYAIYNVSIAKIKYSKSLYISGICALILHMYLPGFLKIVHHLSMQHLESARPLPLRPLRWPEVSIFTTRGRQKHPQRFPHPLAYGKPEPPRVQLFLHNCWSDCAVNRTLSAFWCILPASYPLNEIKLLWDEKTVTRLCFSSLVQIMVGSSKLEGENGIFFNWSKADLQSCVNFCCTVIVIHIYSFLYSLPLWFITGCWI